MVSASPELFFRWDGRRIESRPMKGTMARGRWEQEDSRFRQRLLSSGKDRAENVMIVDLLRNDLGRVARFGSVQVERLFEVERLETVWQMTSTVAAETRPGVGLFDIFKAMFPFGSRPTEGRVLGRHPGPPAGVKGRIRHEHLAPCSGPVELRVLRSFHVTEDRLSIQS